MKSETFQRASEAQFAEKLIQRLETFTLDNQLKFKAWRSETEVKIDIWDFESPRFEKQINFYILGLRDAIRVKDAKLCKRGHIMEKYTNLNNPKLNGKLICMKCLTDFPAEEMEMY